MSVNLNYLKIPLYKLLYMDSLEGFSGFSESQLESLKKTYEPSDLKGILAAIRWATENPDQDFQSLSPEPTPYENHEIYEYLCKLDASMEKLRADLV